MDPETLKLLGTATLNTLLVGAVVVLWRTQEAMRKEQKELMSAAIKDNRDLVDRYHATLLEHVRTLQQILDTNRELLEEKDKKV